MKRNWLIEKRRETNLIQSNVATMVGINRTTYALYESGQRNPSVQIAMKLGEALGFDWTRFFDEEKKGA